MRTLVAIGLAMFGLVIGNASIATAQDSILAELYGYGVHAYFSGQYKEAHDYLTTAIDQGTLDPRVYYFRGLAYTHLGRPDEAKADYEKGAQLETAGADRVYPIGTSLQRIQGKSRLEVEHYRQLARLAMRTRDTKAKAARYEQLKNAEGEVLRDSNRPAPTPAKELVGAPPAQDASDPFGGNAAAAPPKPAPAAPAPAAPAAPAAGGDLFGGAATPEPEPATPEPKPAATEPDPFGGGNDPFGAPAAPAPAAPAAAAPAAEAPAAETPAAEPAKDAATDPFADDAPPADMPAPGDDSDPFK